MTHYFFISRTVWHALTQKTANLWYYGEPNTRQFSIDLPLWSRLRFGKALIAQLVMKFHSYKSPNFILRAQKSLPFVHILSPLFPKSELVM